MNKYSRGNNFIDNIYKVNFKLFMYVKYRLDYIEYMIYCRFRNSLFNRYKLANSYDKTNELAYRKYFTEDDRIYYKRNSRFKPSDVDKKTYLNILVEFEEFAFIHIKDGQRQNDFINIIHECKFKDHHFRNTSNYKI